MIRRPLKLGIYCKNQSSKGEGKKYSATVFGSGENLLQIPMEFEPDLIVASSFNPTSAAHGSTVIHGAYDTILRTGLLRAYNGKDGTAGTLPLKSGTGYYTYENGVVKLGIQAEQYNIRWSPTTEYNIIAMKYDEGGKEIITDQVKKLPENVQATIKYQQEAINKYFTAEEWQALRETKPTYTFVLE